MGWDGVGVHYTMIMIYLEMVFFVVLCWVMDTVIN